jgi:DivIVA domain-containing protein
LTQDLAELPPIGLRPPDDTQEMIAAASEADFPVALRGYDRDSVDAYVRRTNELIETLQATRTPEGAINRALQRVGEEVSGVLRRAHETAEEVTSRSRSEADERLQRAEREAREITTKAVAQLRGLDADTDRIWAERRRIIEDARSLAEELLSLADGAAERFPSAEDGDQPAEPSGRRAERECQSSGQEPEDVLRVEDLSAP